MAKQKNPKSLKSVESLKHRGATRKNIPTAEYQSAAEQMEEMAPVGPVHYPRSTPLAQGATRLRNPDLDPQIVWNGARIRLSPEQIRALQETGEVEIGDAQLVWRGKDQQDWSDLVVQPPQIFIQEKIQPKTIIDDLIRRAREKKQQQSDAPDLFADFNGLPDAEARLEFYQHDQYWSNRMILGDSLQVMASLAERERLRGKVQCIYIDPPYGIKFNSNWQVSTLSRNVKDGKIESVTREPEQVKAFRDTWKDGIHSYLTYLRDRLTVARELLTESGSVFVQIGDENVHRVRALMDEIFNEGNFVSEIIATKTGGQSSATLANVADKIIWYARNLSRIKFRKLYGERPLRDENEASPDPLMSSGYRTNTSVPFAFRGRLFHTGEQYNWKTHLIGMERLAKADRIIPLHSTLRYARFFRDYPVKELTNIWSDLAGAVDLVYVVQTNTKIVQRSILMTTDPGDLVLDPTCGSGTTAYVAEQWGRRWITIDNIKGCASAGPCPHHGRALSLLPPCGQRRGTGAGAEINRQNSARHAVAQRYPPGFCL